MVKRKTSSSSDLRTNSVALSLQRYTDLKALKADQTWGIQHIQPFFPPIERLFKTEVLESPKEFGFKLNENISSIIAADTVRTNKGNTVEVHKKITMLLRPFKWMQGDYGTYLGLPTSEEEAFEIQRKIQDSHNAAYVGALLSVVLSQSGNPHFPKVYGVYTGMSQKHTINISDDYGDLCERSWFSQNIGKTFEIKLADDLHLSGDFRHTRRDRSSLLMGETTDLGDVQELEGVEVSDVQPAEMKAIINDEDEEDDAESDSSSVSTSYIFGIHSCDCDDQDDEDEDDEDEPFAWASFSNVPVQITVMEKCEGTFHELCASDNNTLKHLAWLSQVIFALAFAQRTFGFTHNDLHSNNVMYVSTNKEYLYYNCAGQIYKVPTYGYLIKLIDFERGIGSIKLIGMKEPKLFMSDHFCIDEEAGGQYNFEPWYLPKYPEIKPNPSFDLVRLATSTFWDFFPEGPECEDYKENPIFKLYMKWLTLDGDNSILFGKENPVHDRYHGFHLYKAIARYSKNAVPKTEILALKSFYAVDSVPAGEEVVPVDV